MTPELKAREGTATPSEHVPPPFPKLIESASVVFSTIMKKVSDGVATAALESDRTGITMLEAICGIVRSALRGSPGAGSEMIMGTKAIVMGALWGSGHKDSAALRVLTHTARTVIRQTNAMSGDVGDAVTGLVRGAMAAADRIGVDPAKAAWAVSGAAIEEAYQISATAGRRIRTALRQNVSGIKVASPGRAEQSNSPSKARGVRA